MLCRKMLTDGSEIALTGDHDPNTGTEPSGQLRLSLLKAGQEKTSEFSGNASGVSLTLPWIDCVGEDLWIDMKDDRPMTT